jgi:hypothetical protein
MWTNSAVGCIREVTLSLLPVLEPKSRNSLRDLASILRDAFLAIDTNAAPPMEGTKGATCGTRIDIDRYISIKLGGRTPRPSYESATAGRHRKADFALKYNTVAPRSQLTPQGKAKPQLENRTTHSTAAETSTFYPPLAATLQKPAAWGPAHPDTCNSVAVGGTDGARQTVDDCSNVVRSRARNGARDKPW